VNCARLASASGLGGWRGEGARWEGGRGAVGAAGRGGNGWRETQGSRAWMWVGKGGAGVGKTEAWWSRAWGVVGQVVGAAACSAGRRTLTVAVRTS